MPEKNSTILELESRVSGRDAAMAGLEKKLKVQAESISRLRSRVSSRDEAIAKLKENLYLQTKDISLLTSKLSVRTSYIEDLEENSETQAESILDLRSEISRKDVTIADLEENYKQAEFFLEIYQAGIERKKSQMNESGGRKFERISEVHDESILKLRSELQATMKREQNRIEEVEKMRLWIDVWGVERELTLIKEVENLEKRVKNSELMMINQRQRLKVAKFITAQLMNESKNIIAGPTRQINEVHLHFREFNAELEKIHNLTSSAVIQKYVSRRGSQ